MHGSTALYNGSGLQTESKVYDYGTTTARGSLLREEIWTYGTSVPGLVTNDAVYDSTGTTLAGQTVYQYDGSTPTGSSGVPQHVAATGARGNLTSVQQFASSGTSYTTTATYEDTGTVLTVLAPTGTTRLGYDTTFSFNTGVTPPTPSSGISQPSSGTYDTTHTGLPLSATDPNGAKTSIASYDSLWRPTEVDALDSGSNQIAKAIATYSPTLVDQKTYQSASVFAETQTQLDAYGRVSRTATANGQSGNPWYQQDTCYDGNGNPSFTSYPYQSTGFSSQGKICSGDGGGDVSTYDVLGRLTSVQRQNGETRTYQYLGRALKTTDESGVVRISQVDGLGRTTIVCEISSSTSMPSSGSPVSCGTDISGTGFTTTYAYALATGTTTVTQGAQSRTFQTDWLGRTTSVTEPESGTTAYSYAYNGTGLVVTRKRPTANQTSATVLTTTTSQYDSLGRVLTVSYTDGTPTKTFAYDAAASWGNGFTQSNLVGRLSSASVPTSSNFAATVFSYDGLGRTTGLGECLPSQCGTVADNKSLAYGYDLAGNLLSSSDGNGVTTTYTYSTANEVQSLTSSKSGTGFPSNLISAVANGPNGPISYNMGNGLTHVSQFDGLGRVVGGSLCSGSSAIACAGGTFFHGWFSSWQGTHLTEGCDTLMSGQCSDYNYDEFGRVISRTVVQGAAQNFTYAYDRYGNRWQQNAINGGPQPQLSFNTSNNHNTAYTYDAVGHVMSDGTNSYQYDAEGNLIKETSGSTTLQWAYNALNQQVSGTFNADSPVETVFDAFGNKASGWFQGNVLTGRAYWGATPVESYNSTAAHYTTRDGLGSLRMQTDGTGNVTDERYTLPFGDGATGVSGGRDDTDDGFTGLWDGGTGATNHAQFREYSNQAGSWLQPDPYYGSYDFTNPQSMNRYAYVLNNPLGYIDPLGLDTYTCITLNVEDTNGNVVSSSESCALSIDLLDFLGGPSFSTLLPLLPITDLPLPTRTPPSQQVADQIAAVNNCTAQANAAMNAGPSVAPTYQNVIDGVMAGALTLGTDGAAEVLPILTNFFKGAAVRSAGHAAQNGLTFLTSYHGCLAATGQGRPYNPYSPF
jgi:RHS repeat-associated protein